MNIILVLEETIQVYIFFFYINESKFKCLQHFYVFFPVSLLCGESTEFLLGNLKMANEPFITASNFKCYFRHLHDFS